MNDFPIDKDTIKQCAAAHAVDDVVEKMCTAFNTTSKIGYLNETTAVVGVDKDAVHSAFKFDTPVV